VRRLDVGRRRRRSSSRDAERRRQLAGRRAVPGYDGDVSSVARGAEPGAVLYRPFVVW